MQISTYSFAQFMLNLLFVDTHDRKEYITFITLILSQKDELVVNLKSAIHIAIRLPETFAWLNDYIFRYHLFLYWGVPCSDRVSGHYRHTRWKTVYSKCCSIQVTRHSMCCSIQVARHSKCCSIQVATDICSDFNKLQFCVCCNITTVCRKRFLLCLLEFLLMGCFRSRCLLQECKGILLLSYFLTFFLHWYIS